MNSSIEQMRQRALEIEERNRRQQEEYSRKRERDQDREDENRRHRERLAAMSRREAPLPTPSISFRAALKLFAAGAALFGIAFVWNIMSPLNESPANRLGTSSSSEAESAIAGPHDEISLPPYVEPIETTPANDIPNERSPMTEAIRPPSSTELRRATLKALESGTSATWQSGDRGGIVTVSTPVALSGRVCRSVSVSVSEPVTNQPQLETWCSTPSGNWTKS